MSSDGKWKQASAQSGRKWVEHPEQVDLQVVSPANLLKLQSDKNM